MIVWSVLIGLMVLLYQLRCPLLTIDYGTHYWLVVLGLLCLGGATVLWTQHRRQLGLKTMLGVPELDPEGQAVALLTEGIYARIRHPRYVEMALSLLAYALIANYLAGYILVILFLIGIYAVVLLEERELRARFGVEYEAYCRQVPRFLPREWLRF